MSIEDVAERLDSLENWKEAMQVEMVTRLLDQFKTRLN